jgi:hypothetical protein
MSKMSHLDIERHNMRKGHREMILNAPSLKALDRVMAMLVPPMGDKYIRRCKLAEARARARLNNN